MNKMSICKDAVCVRRSSRIAILTRTTHGSLKPLARPKKPDSQIKVASQAKLSGKGRLNVGSGQVVKKQRRKGSNAASILVKSNVQGKQKAGSTAEPAKCVPASGETALPVVHQPIEVTVQKIPKRTLKSGATRDAEEQLWDKGHEYVVGVDEAGRGPLVGPVVAAAVLLPRSMDVAGIADSKALSETQREEVYQRLTEDPAVLWAVAIVDHDTIDAINILQATMKAMSDAVASVQAKHTVSYALIDGNRVPSALTCPGQALVKGDAKSIAIAAASILAKVTRDRLMNEIDKEYPQYGFAQHKGYGVPAHFAAIRKHGPCKLHRKSFEPIKSILKWERPKS